VEFAALIHMDGVATTFLLGLSLGGGCLAHCGPALLPLVLSQGSRKALLAALFLAGRLAGYLLAAILFVTSERLLAVVFDFIRTAAFAGAVQLVLALVLFRYALAMRRECSASCAGGDSREVFARFRAGKIRYALQGGFLTGLSFCTPMLALAGECASGGYAHGVISALAFFLGTSAVLVPVVACGILCRGRAAAEIGFFAACGAALLCLFQSLFLFLQAFSHS
jgi:hypothetical protein